MSSYDKVVKLACKPKAAVPKPKYLDTILAATWSEDGAVHDVCKALSPRFREPNAIIVFKALIVLHTMIRNGATDNVLAYLSSSEVLRLRNVSTGNWEGYNTPQNLQHYAIYLDSRIRAYRDLKHDAIRVQAESNRDMRNNNSIEEDMAYRGGPKNDKGPQRSKTIMGRKLRSMTVEKGLLRETKAVQKMIDSLVECRFYLDDLEDELTTTALRMLVKDLLILFQAGNEGVINVLEHYFEMSKPDAEAALAIYRHFCKQTERVVEYLGVAKKLQNLLGVSIPNLKHAPVSLAGALEEYIKDPNFEQNRVEYKANKQSADKSNGAPSLSSNNGSVSSKSKISFAEAKKPEKVPSSSKTPVSSTATSSAAKPEPTQAMQDFFSAIEEEQPTMFNPQTGSPTANYFQQQAAHNPFAAFGAQPTGIHQQLQQQPTGFIMPQQTAFQPPLQQQPQQAPNPFGLQAAQQQQQAPNPFGLQPPPQQQQQAPNPFGLQPPQQQQQQQHQPFSSFLQSQNGGLLQSQPTGFLQPQATGANPFRQSMMMTGFSPSPFAQDQPGPSQQQGPNFNTGNPPPFSTSPFASSQSSSPFPNTPFSATPFSQNPAIQSAADLPARPASTPLTSFGSSSQSTSNSPPEAQPVKSHQTGSRNPFGVPVAPAPPVPKAPTLMELYMNGGSTNTSLNGQNGQPQQQPQQQQQTGSLGGLNGFGTSGGAGDSKGDMASVASEFSFNKGKADENKSGLPASLGSFPFLSSQNTATSGSTFSDSIFSSLNSQPTGATTTTATGNPSISLSPTLKPQTTGFSGLKAFKPSSNFGASLLESLPPIPGSNPSTPGVTGGPSPAGAPNSAPGGISSFSGASAFGSQATGMGALNSQPTGAPSFGGLGGSGLGSGLRPQMTGGAANPFRASMANPMGGPMNGSTGAFSSSNSTPAFGGGNLGLSSSNGQPFGAFSTGPFGSGFNPNGGTQDSSKQQQHNGSSLI